MLLRREEVARRARQLYKNIIRQQVETNENIRKMLIIDFESGDYKVDETRLKAARKLSAKHLHSSLFHLRMGYNVAVSFGGVIERVYK
jgi:hypothetical protein